MKILNKKKKKKKTIEYHHIDICYLGVGLTSKTDNQIFLVRDVNSISANTYFSFNRENGICFFRIKTFQNYFFQMIFNSFLNFFVINTYRRERKKNTCRIFFICRFWCNYNNSIQNYLKSEQPGLKIKSQNLILESY